MRVPVSAVIITKDEASNLRRCLESLRWCDDVVVVDDFSRDETREIAIGMGARVLCHAFSSFAAQRNWAIEQGACRHDWILMLDADEQATPAFGEELTRKLKHAESTTAAFTICRKTMLGNNWLRYSDGFPVWIMRVVRRGRATFRDSGHGEVPVPPVEGTIDKIEEPIVHYPFSKGLTDWIDRHNRYSSREAAREMDETEQVGWSTLWFGERAARRQALRSLSRRVPCRPLLRFVYQYIWKWGVLDGRAGFDFSLLMAAYEAMIVMKRRELGHRFSERYCPRDAGMNRQ